MQVPEKTIVVEQPGEYGAIKMSQLAMLIEAYGTEHPELFETSEPVREVKAS